MKISTFVTHLLDLMTILYAVVVTKLQTPVSNMITIENVGAVVEIPIKGAKCLKLSMKEGLSERDYILRPEVN